MIHVKNYNDNETHNDNLGNKGIVKKEVEAIAITDAWKAVPGDDFSTIYKNPLLRNNMIVPHPS